MQAQSHNFFQDSRILLNLVINDSFIWAKESGIKIDKGQEFSR